MQRARRFWSGAALAGALLLVLVAGVATTQVVESQRQHRGEQPPGRDLRGKPDALIAQQAVEWAQASRLIKPGGHAEVLIAKEIPRSELEQYGLPPGHPTDPSTAAIAIMRSGDFDTTGLFPGFGPDARGRQPQYVGLVMDPANGQPHGFSASPRGAAFKKVLRDPSLPDTDLYPDEMRGPSEPLPPPPVLRPNPGDPGPPGPVELRRDGPPRTIPPSGTPGAPR